MGSSLRHDEEGFLIGRTKAGMIDQKLKTVVENTESTLKLLKGRVDNNRVVVSGRVRVTGMAANAANYGNKPSPAPVRQVAADRSSLVRGNHITGGRRADGKDANKSLVKSIKEVAPAVPAAKMPLAKQGDQHLTKSEIRRQRRQQAMELRESQRQTKLLKDIKTKSDSSSGMLKMLLPFLLGGGLIKSILKAPSAIFGGSKAGGGALRDASGKFIKGGATSWLGKGGKFLKGLGKAGIIGSLIGAWNGINIEGRDDLSRGNKNKEHAKNVVTSVGGIGGALVGAKLGAAVGSVVPFAGTAVGAVAGGILGGIGGAELVSAIADKIGDVLPEGLGEQMFGSWDGMVSGLKTIGITAGNLAMQGIRDGAQHVYYDYLPQEVAITMGAIGGMASDAWNAIEGFASETWAEVTRLATPYYDAATAFASDVWSAFKNAVGPWFDTIGGYAETAFNAFSELSGQFFTWLGNTWLGQQVGDAWDGVKSFVSNTWEKVTDYAKSKTSQASKDYNAGKQKHDQKHAQGARQSGGGVTGGVVVAIGGSGPSNGRSGESGAGTSGVIEKTLSIIREHEGFRSKTYWDVNHWRLGYGSDQITSPNGQVREVKKGDIVSREDAERDLRRRTNIFRNAARNKIGADKFDQLPQGAQAALTSVAYNYGSLDKLPSLVRAAQSGDLKKISSAILARQVDNNGDNRERRKKEALLVLSDTKLVASTQSATKNIIDNPKSRPVLAANMPAYVSDIEIASRAKGDGPSKIKVASVESMVQTVPVSARSNLAMARSLNSKASESGYNLASSESVTSGQIAHMPTVGRTVSNKHIANIVSGGITMA